MAISGNTKNRNWKLVRANVPKIALDCGYKSVPMVSNSVLRFENSKVYIDVYGGTLTVGVIFKARNHSNLYSRQCSLEDIESIFKDNFFDNGTTYSERPVPSKDNPCK